MWRISQVWHTHVYGVVILSPQRVTLKFERLYTLIPNKEGPWVLGLQGSVASILYSGVGMYFKVGQPTPHHLVLNLCQTNTCCRWSVQNLFNINFSGKKVWRPWAFQPPPPSYAYDVYLYCHTPLQHTAHYDNMLGSVSLGGSSRPSDLLTHTSHAPVSHDDWEVPPSDIVVDQTLGEGAFGEVYKGYLKGPITCSKVVPIYRNSVHVGVAIKLLKGTQCGCGHIMWVWLYHVGVTIKNLGFNMMRVWLNYQSGCG